MIEDGRHIVHTTYMITLCLICAVMNCIASGNSENNSFNSDVEEPAYRLKEQANYHLGLGEIKQAFECLDSALLLTSDAALKTELNLTKSGLFFIQFQLDEALTAANEAELTIDKTDFNTLTGAVFLKAGILHYSGKLYELNRYTEESILKDNSIEAHNYNDKLIEHHNNNLLWHNGLVSPGIKFFKEHIDNNHILHLSESTYYRYLGDLHLIRDEFEEAMSFYNRISTKEDDFAVMGFTYYSRVVETLLQLGDYQASTEYLRKLKSDKFNKGNPYKSNYLEYLSLAQQIYSQTDDLPVQACDALISTTRKAGLVFLADYYALKFAQAFFSIEQIDEAEEYINKIPYLIEDAVSDYKRKQLLIKIAEFRGHDQLVNKLNAALQSDKENLEIIGISPTKLRSKIDSIHPLVSPKTVAPEWFKILMGIIAAMFFGFFLLYKRNQSRIAREKEDMRQEYEQLREEYESIEQMNAESGARGNKNELEKLLAEKDAKINSFERSLEIQSKDKLLKLAQYKERIEKLEGQLGLLEKRTTGSLKEEIKQLISKVDLNLDADNYLEDFTLQIESNHPALVVALNAFPQLSNRQRILCYTIKLDMSISETAQLLTTSKPAIKKARNRIWKQLDFKSYDDFKRFVQAQ